MNISDEAMQLTMQGINIDSKNCLLNSLQSPNTSLYNDIEGIDATNEANDMSNNSLYYFLSEFNNLKGYNNMLTIMHLNIASLNVMNFIP